MSDPTVDEARERFTIAWNAYLGVQGQAEDAQEGAMNARVAWAIAEAREREGVLLAALEHIATCALDDGFQAARFMRDRAAQAIGLSGVEGRAARLESPAAPVEEA